MHACCLILQFNACPWVPVQWLLNSLSEETKTFCKNHRSGLAWLGLAWLGAVSTSNCLFALLLATRRHAAAVAVAYARHGCGLRLALCLGDLAQLLTVERCKTQEAFA